MAFLASSYLSQAAPLPHCCRLAAIDCDALLLARLAGPGEAGTRGLRRGTDERGEHMLLRAEAAVLVVVVRGING